MAFGGNSFSGGSSNIDTGQLRKASKLFVDQVLEARKRAREAAIAKNLAQRRDAQRMRLRGAASTRVSAVTPDLFATIGAPQKQLLG